MPCRVPSTMPEMTNRIPLHTDPCDGLMQRKHAGQQMPLDVFPFSHICAEAPPLDKFILAEPVAFTWEIL